MTNEETRKAILDYMNKKHGSIPNFKTVGVDYREGQKAFDELKAEGLIVEGVRISQKGRKMTTFFTKEKPI